MHRITFVNHSIPDVTLSAIYKNKIYYIYDGYLYMYKIDDSKSLKISECPNSTYISIYKSILCIVSSNRLILYKQTEYTVEKYSSFELFNIPNKTVCSKDGLVFIFDSLIQIYDGSFFSIKNYSENSIKDICFLEKECFVLANQGIYRMINIFYSHMLSFNKQIRIVPECDNINCQNSISAVENYLLLSNESQTSKYELYQNFMTLQYSLQKTGHFYGNLLSTHESTILLDKAPFLLFKDSIYFYSEGMGLSASRIYFIESVSEENNVKNYCNEPFRVQIPANCTINKNLLNVPAYITDSITKSKYLDISADIKQYETIYDRIEKISNTFTEREKELINMRNLIHEDIKKIEISRSDIANKMNSIRERASRVMVGREVKEFHHNIKKLTSIIDKIQIQDLHDIKKRLRSQNLALQSKIMK